MLAGDDCGLYSTRAPGPTRSFPKARSAHMIQAGARVPHAPAAQPFSLRRTLMVVRLFAAVFIAFVILPASPVSQTATAPGVPAPATSATTRTSAAQAAPAERMTPEQIVSALRKPENSTGNIADAVE